MTDIKTLIKPKKICVFLGSGFDKNIGMPTWSNLIDEYSSFLVGNIDIRRVEGLKKIELIKNSDLSLMRKYSMLKSLEQEHTNDYQKNQNKFIEMVYDVHSYDLKNIFILKDFINSIREMQNVRVITTNISNTLEELGLETVTKASDLVDSISFFPVHGIIKNKELKPVLSELDYLGNESAYEEFNNTLKEYEQIHIFGYSLNDFKILNILKKSGISKIYFYFLYDDEIWKEIIEKHIREIFPSPIDIEFRSIKTNWSIEKNNELIKILIGDIKEFGTPFTDIKDIQYFMEDENE